MSRHSLVPLESQQATSTLNIDHALGSLSNPGEEVSAYPPLWLANKRPKKVPSFRGEDALLPGSFAQDQRARKDHMEMFGRCLDC